MSIALQLFANNASSFLAANIGTNETQLRIAANSGILFPSPANNEYFLVTIENILTKEFEIVKVISRQDEILTIIRAQEDTTPKSFPSGSRVELRVTKGTLANLRDIAISGGIANYEHNQAIDSDVWTIIHNLDRYPAVMVKDVNNNTVFADVQFLSLNIIEINFSQPMKGKAILA